LEAGRKLCTNRFERLTVPAIADIVLKSDLDKVRQVVDDLMPSVGKSVAADFEVRLDNIHSCPRSRF